MSKRRFTAALAISTLLISLPGLQFVNFASANFAPFPSGWNDIPPANATVISPKNNTVYNSSNVYFKFNSVFNLCTCVYLDGELLKTFYITTNSISLPELMDGEHYVEVRAYSQYKPFFPPEATPIGVISKAAVVAILVS